MVGDLSRLFRVGVAVIISECRRFFSSYNSRKMLEGCPTMLHSGQGGYFPGTLGVSTFFRFLFPLFMTLTGVTMGVYVVMMNFVEVIGMIYVKVIPKFPNMDSGAKY